ncbi:MAG: pyridoxal phosphate-dependent aminotransferase [Sulfuricellaceae bacterium]|jgi:aspartate/methionine/tyrosine aminotransferase
MPRRIAKRLEGIQPFHVMEVLAKARQLEAAGRSIIHMEIGEPDFPTPEPILEAARRALRQEPMHYTPALGLPALREAIARHYGNRYGVEVSPERIVVTAGASAALLLAAGMLLDPGRRLLLADPGYPCNRHFARFVGAEAAGVPVGPETAYQLTADLVERHWSPETAAVLLASPSNPTGTVVPGEELKAISATVDRLGGALIVDEIYHGLTYGEHAPSVLEVNEEAFVVNSFSKYFTMTGWRLGWLVVPQDYIRAADTLQQNLYIAAPTPAQHAALAAFEPETLAILEQRRQEMIQRRDYLLPALRKLGFGLPLEPQGAFYLYADCSRFTQDSHGFALDVLDRAGVAITPGLDFGSNQPERHVRFAYTTSLDNLREGVSRLRAYLGQ